MGLPLKNAVGAPPLCMYQMRTMPCVLEARAATRALQNSLPMSNSLNGLEVEAITSISGLAFVAQPIAAGKQEMALI